MKKIHLHILSACIVIIYVIFAVSSSEDKKSLFDEKRTQQSLTEVNWITSMSIINTNISDMCMDDDENLLIASIGGNILHLRKISGQGNTIWNKQYQGEYNFTEVQITTDKEANIFIAGRLGGYSGRSGSDENNIDINIDEENIDEALYLIKIDAEGNYKWVNTYGGKDENNIVNLKCDQNGFVYLAVNYDKEPIKFGKTLLINDGGKDLAIVKLDNNGNVHWAYSFIGNSIDKIIDMDVDGCGNIYCVTQINSNSIVFNKQQYDLNDDGNSYIIKIYNEGKIGWIRSLDIVISDIDNLVSHIESDENGNIYAYVYSGTSDYLVKYTADGETKWSTKLNKQFGDQRIFDICIDKFGDVYTTGMFTEDSCDFYNVVVYNFGAGEYDRSEDLFISKYSATLGIQWVKVIAGSDGDIGLRIDKGAQNIYIMGISQSEYLCILPDEEYYIQDEYQYYGNQELIIMSFPDKIQHLSYLEQK